MPRYQNYQGEAESADLEEMAQTVRVGSKQRPMGFTGDTWDARHMTSFLSQSNYSNWRGEQANISRLSNSHKRAHSTHDHFFKTTKDNKNQSKIGYTPIFPLVSNIAPQGQTEKTLANFFQGTPRQRQDRVVSGRSLKLRCSPDEKFKFEGNAMKYQSTNPLTMEHQPKPHEQVSGFQKERMTRLIEKRHPHGMTGIDHPENPETKHYRAFEDKIRVRMEPNTHRSFLIDREWKSKGRSEPPVDEWKHRQTVAIRKFRNDNVHGYNILTNRL